MLEVGRRARGADRPPRPRRQLLAGRPGRPVRPVLGALPTTAASTSAAPTTGPATTPSASSSSGTSCSCSSSCTRTARRRRCPAQNIDTGLGLDRFAAILQDVPSVYETEHFRPLIAFGEERSGKKDGGDPKVDARAAHPGRPRPRHDVPARRRRRAVERGPRLRAAPHHAPRDPPGPRARPRELPARPHRRRDRRRWATPIPNLQRRARHDPAQWTHAEEESFGRTLAQGERLLGDIIKRAKAAETSWVDAEDAFRLHDTYGFPYELTKELLAEEGLAVDDQGFDELMERRAADRARAARASTPATPVTRRSPRSRAAPASRRASSATRRSSGSRRSPRSSASTAVTWPSSQESPFYPEGGGQVSDSGYGRDAVRPRAGDRRLPGRRRPGGRARARGGRARASASRPRRASRATSASPPSATTPPPICCTPRCASGSAPHVRQAGSYVGPDKLRFDFTHGERLVARGARRRRSRR